MIAMLLCGGLILGSIIIGLIIGFLLDGSYYITYHKYRKILASEVFKPMKKDFEELLKLDNDISHASVAVTRQEHKINDLRQQLPLSTNKERPALENKIELEKQKLSALNEHYHRLQDVYAVQEEILYKFITEKLSPKEQVVFKKHFYFCGNYEKKA